MDRDRDRNNEGIEVRAAQHTHDIRRAAQEGPQDSVVALVDQSRLRRECLKLALTEHESAWRILDLASAEDVLRLAEGGQKFDLLLLGAATAELVDLAQIEMLHQALPETPIVVVAENDNPHRARRLRAVVADRRGPAARDRDAVAETPERALVRAHAPPARRTRAHRPGQI